MSGWRDGYIADVSYTAGFYRETTPRWLAFAALLLGHRPPDLARPFCWAELGCGQGLSATIAAACHPEAAFWGFDFNPSHIDSARHLAAVAGLDNLRFREASFEQLAGMPEGALPDFDFIVLHGVWSWVSPAQRCHLRRFIERRLAPGGLVYVSYNSAAGWGAMAPVQRLMQRMMAGHDGPAHERVGRMIEWLRALAATDAVLFQQHPDLARRLEQLAKHDPRYVVHEYLNRFWQPTGFDEVSAALAEARCGFIGSATLLDNIDAVAAPPAVGKLIAGTGDVVMREMLRDVAAARAFRRDLYRRGTDQPLPGEHAALLRALTITGTGRESDKDIQIATGIGHTTPKPEVYQPVLERLARGPLPLDELCAMPHLGAHELADAVQIATFLAAGGIAHPSLAGEIDPRALAAAARLNRAIALANSRGGSMNVLAAPRLATGLQIDPIEALLLDRLAAPGEPDVGGMTRHLLSTLAATGRSVMRDGVVQDDPVAAETAMRDLVLRTVNQRLPVLRRLGIV